LRGIKIETLALVKELENAGVPRQQAEAQIQTTIKVIDMAIEEKLITKHDLNHALHRTEEKLSSKQEKLSEDVNELKNKTDHISITLEHMPSSITNRLYKSLGSIMALGFTAMGLLIALHH